MPTVANSEIIKLWQMPKRQFDQWRRENDLPQLLEFLKTVLPHFGEWQQTQRIDDGIFLQAAGQSQFFRGDRAKYLVSMSFPDEESGEGEITTVAFHDLAFDRDADEAWQRKHFGGEIRYRTNWLLGFTPYFRWLRQEKRLKSFRIPSEANALKRDFEYSRWEAYNTSFSRASLFHTHRVLKVGGVTVDAQRLDGRNLDFVDLDWLTVTGKWTNRSTAVVYSSCRRLRFKNCEPSFLSFEKCQIDDLLVENCRLYKWSFLECRMPAPVFRRSRLFQVAFIETIPGGIDFDDCELIDVTLQKAPSRVSPDGLRDFYKRLRVAFQHQGDRNEAARCYYHERLQQLRGHLTPIIPRGKGLPGLAYADPLSDLYEQWQQHVFDTRQVRTFLAKSLLCILKIALLPHFLIRFIREKLKLIPEGIDWLMWGVGERPVRVFVWMALVIVLFAVGHYTRAESSLNGDLAGSLSCSALNFAAMGCDHRTQFDAAEGILGAILLGVMVPGFANRTRY